ncbi:MAG: hypothetical protein A4E60_02438 [Syntrophorhabdus sp. PtaB.Bin047]|nr:MAG: hypothetical protein A4E60_02438 [Syntrophorhabdus sp. PtaB.Bin047]
MSLPGTHRSFPTALLCPSQVLVASTLVSGEKHFEDTTGSRVFLPTPMSLPPSTVYRERPGGVSKSSLWRSAALTGAPARFDPAGLASHSRKGFCPRVIRTSFMQASVEPFSFSIVDIAFPAHARPTDTITARNRANRYNIPFIERPSGKGNPSQAMHMHITPAAAQKTRPAKTKDMRVVTY